MRLWTIKTASVWEKLQQQKILLVDPELAEDSDWGDSYRWLIRQMGERIPYYRGGWPWWAWYQPKPDLREYRFRLPASDTELMVRIELEIPDHCVLLSDYDAWHAVLNHTFLAISEEEDNDFDRWCCEVRGVPYDPERSWCWDRNQPTWTEEMKQAIQQRKEETWLRCLDLDLMRTSKWYGGGDMIQATFEELRLDEVKKVTYFRWAGPELPIYASSNGTATT